MTMHIRIVQILVGAATTLQLATPLLAPTPVGGATGQTTFATYCATCHGANAKGDGPLAAILKIRPADLTQIAVRRSGTFPAEEVARIIDGRRPVKGHGGGGNACLG